MRPNSFSRLSDTGIGIPPEKQGMIFETFTQAETLPPFANTAGTGLGLAISNNWCRADAADGSGWRVRREKEAHSLFTATFDVQKAPPVNPVPNSSGQL
jgi:signal transduction histidine kinase